jgi:hypothetical protein
MKDLPVKKTDEFLGEAEVMDLSALKDKHYIVAVNTGDPEKFGLLGSTIHGPYTFVEMVQEVGDMWATHQHHAKVIVLEKSYEKATEMLDPNTIDYIELKYNDIITEAMLEGAFDEEQEFTCKAGLVSDSSEDPRLAKKEESIDSIEDAANSQP